MKRILSVALVLAAFSSTALWAGKWTFTAAGGEAVEFDVPDSFDAFIEDYKEQIQEAITENNVSSSDLNSAKTEIENAVGTSSLPKEGAADFAGVYGTIGEGLDGFSSSLIDALPSAQANQNLWADSWIGYLVPKFNIGLGVDAGAALVNTSVLKSLVSAIGIEGLDGLTQFLPGGRVPVPTLNADIRIGGIVLPFDIGFSILKLDTSRINGLNDVLSGLTLDLFSIGGDLRYALIKNGPLHSKVSVNVGYYYTKTALDFAGGDGGIKAAGIELESKTFTVGAQASAKLLKFLVPYAGVRLMVSKGSLGWSLTPDWATLLGGSMDSAAAYFLPKSLGGTVSSDFSWRPQIYAGLSLDLFVIDITAGIGYTFVSNVVNGAVSVRLAWH